MKLEKDMPGLRRIPTHGEPHMIEINKIYNMDCLEGIANDRIRKALAEKEVGE